MKKIFHRVKKIFASLALSAGMLAFAPGVAGGYDTDAETAPSHPTVFLDDDSTRAALDSLKEVRKQEALKIFGDSVNTTNRKDSFYYPQRYGKKFPIVYTATSQKEEDVDPAVKDLWQNMQLLKGSETLLGPSLADFSARAKILYAYEWKPKVYGSWRSKDGIVRISNADELPQDLELIVQVHETIHGVQRSTGVIRGNLLMPTRDCQASLLSYEAAAMTGSYIIALELRLDGNFGPWRELEKITPKRCKKILTVWDKACKDSTSYQDALEKTAAAIFYQQFNEQWWLDGYNGKILRTYMGLLAKEKIKKASDDTWTLDDLRMTGYVSSEFNFTAGLDSIPSAETMFGENERMRRAFEYIELQRIGAVRGRTSDAYNVRYQKLKAAGNPYIDLDAKKVHESYQHCRQLISMVEVMDLMADGEDLMSINLSGPKTVKSLTPPSNGPHLFCPEEDDLLHISTPQKRELKP